MTEQQDNYQGSDAAKAAHMMDLYTALGVRWGDDPFAVIAKMRDQQPKQEQGEPWGACVSGRVFVGTLPEHVRKLSEDEGLPIQWLYTTPQQRTWVGLTDEERFEVADHSDCFEDVVDAVEAKLKEKNG